MKKYNICVVGATGIVGHELINVLQEREFPVNNLSAVAGKGSVGKKVSFGDSIFPVLQIEDIDFSDINICFMCAGSRVSEKYVEKITKFGCTIIDKTSFFRLRSNVPLVIPEINLSVLQKGANSGIISNPNCVAIPLAMALKPLHELSKIKRIIVSTYQSVSGAGRSAVGELYNKTKTSLMGSDPSDGGVFDKDIAFNVIPEIGAPFANGITEEEEKIGREMIKIFATEIATAITCVRVPVFIGHSMSVACEFTTDINMEEAAHALRKFEGVSFIDDYEDYITPKDAQGEDDVFVSRLRRDPSVKYGLLMWITVDNLRKGAALNGVQIAESIVSIDPTLNMFKSKVSEN